MAPVAIATRTGASRNQSHDDEAAAQPHRCLDERETAAGRYIRDGKIMQLGLCSEPVSNFPTGVWRKLSMMRWILLVIALLRGVA